MEVVSSRSSVKVVGANGQISLGKQYAGCQVLEEERDPGVWMVRTAAVIPDNERCLHEPRAAADLQAALAYVTANPASRAQAVEVLDRLLSLDEATDAGCPHARVLLDLNNLVFQ